MLFNLTAHKDTANKDTEQKLEKPVTEMAYFVTHLAALFKITRFHKCSTC